MKKWVQSTGLFKRYAALFFAVIMLVAMGITLLLLDFSSQKFMAYELGRIEDDMITAAEDMESQYEVLRSVAHQISATLFYRPGILQGDTCREIELLEDFARFANYSPLIRQYFLFYQDNQKIYTSEGKSSYYRYFSTSVLGMDSAESERFFEVLNQTTQETMEAVGEKRLFLFPIRFSNIDQSAERAVLCFIIHPDALRNRMCFVAARLPEQIALRINEMPVFGEEQIEWEKIRGENGVVSYDGTHYLVTARTERGQTEVAGAVEIARWPLLLTNLPQWLYINVFLAILVVSALAALLAHTAVRPLQRLINKYAEPTDTLQNEFVQLDQMIAQIEEKNQNSARLLRDRTLMTILRGYYSERVMNLWSFSHVKFDKAQYCAAVLGADNMEPEQAERVIARIEQAADKRTRVFAMHAITENMIAVIIGFDDAADKEKAIGMISAGLDEGASLFVGEVCASPPQLSGSYVDALAAYQRGLERENIDAHSFVVRLVAAAEADNRVLLEQLEQQMIQHYGRFSVTLMKKIATELVSELSALAVEKQTALDKERLSALVMISDIEVFWTNMQEIVCQAFYREPQPSRDRLNQTASAIVEYVNEHAFDPDLDLSSIGMRFERSNDYVSAMVKTTTGFSFKEYLTDLRMRHACTLLLERRDMTITEISEAVGYRKPSNFIKKFKDIYGVTPSQYR